ncbi:MAG: enoyl-CoA hydratase/isomerase family protein [Candidatus Aminicenantes bacterium]|nr:enoyl-CoA hydratase/isomerase family protein [Candidatus Aminicenantes bacterium]
MAFVKTRIDSSLALLTLTDGREGNRLNLERLEELSSSMDAAFDDKNVRVVLLRSNGPAFCLGMDLERLMANQAEKHLEEAVSLYSSLLIGIIEAPKPVIALVQGDVKAGGVGLAAACDIVVTADDASFELPEVFLGLIPANVLPFLLLLRMTPSKARYVTLTGKKLQAEEARLCGLADEVFPRQDLEKELKSIIKRLMRASPQALARIKRFTGEMISEMLRKKCGEARKELIELVNDEKVAAAIKSFLNGGTPPWFVKFRPEKSLVE